MRALIISPDDRLNRLLLLGHQISLLPVVRQTWAFPATYSHLHLGSLSALRVSEFCRRCWKPSPKWVKRKGKPSSLRPCRRLSGTQAGDVSRFGVQPTTQFQHYHRWSIFFPKPQPVSTPYSSRWLTRVFRYPVLVAADTKIMKNPSGRYPVPSATAGRRELWQAFSLSMVSDHLDDANTGRK